VNLLERPGTKAAAIEDVYWGTDIGGEMEIERELRGWSELVTFEKRADMVTQAARLMAEGKVFGWVQGRSEFGPRALGNRSILADPRPAENKDIINRMVKKREAYRPFAPSVLAERVDEFFVLPGVQKDFGFMTFVVDVQPDKRVQLGAITHVDGTARVQTVTRASNPRYWELIRAFGEITGVPILLNTSFNNHAEPIVDSVREAIACFLTTELHHLVIGDFFVSKKNVVPADEALFGLAVTLPENLALRRERKRSADAADAGGAEGARGARWETTCVATFTQHRGKSATLSDGMAAVLERANGVTSVSELAARAGVARTVEARAELAAELRELWSNRVVVLRPVGESLDCLDRAVFLNR
ncbi:MAG TPA: carbamoyltransferase C-terminal domain-containing protein, partial [Opitutus sp.]|nr:carbamoyltransferase C-terminal domain-containing protein [Opitutus sp.]